MKSILLFTLLSLILPWFGLASIPVQSSLTGVEPEVLESENLMTQLFHQWREQHGKNYHQAEEMSKRLEIFKQNLKYVVETNKKQTGFTVGLNRFADLSNEEFKERYFGKTKNSVQLNQMMNMTNRKSVMSCDAPPALDWREKGVITPVKDQGQCGACWAFSATGAIEAINAINNRELVSLSEQELLDCDKIDEACDGGIMEQAFEWIKDNGGIDTEEDYPYTGVQRACNRNKVEKKIVHIDGYKDLDNSDSSLLCAVINQPVAVGLQGSSFDFQLYNRGIYDGSCSNNPKDIDHAVLVVGYGSENGKDYWILKNSWGTNWGMNGYMYLRRNTNLPYGVCGVNTQPSYPIQTPSAPSPDSPPSPPQPLPPPYSPPPPSPTPPSPPPTLCGDSAYCSADQTCCCTFEFFDYCITYGCCDYKNAVCCKGDNSCCPPDYPICDTLWGLCFKYPGDQLGVPARKQKLAKYKLPWSNDKFEESEEITYQPLQFKRNQFAAMR